MPFVTFDRAAQERSARRNRQGPPQITVSEPSSTGRTQITLSGAVRDYLQPTERRDRGMSERVMFVRLLVDHDLRKVAIQRAPDNADPSDTYKVGGLNNAAGAAYFTDWRLDEAIGLRAGTYPATLTRMRGEETALQSLAVVISLDDLIPAEQRKRVDKITAQIQQILAVRDEGITLTHEPVRRT